MMEWPQILMMLLLSANLGIYLAKHGQERDDFSFPAGAFSLGLTTALLWWGGFWG